MNTDSVSELLDLDDHLDVNTPLRKCIPDRLLFLVDRRVLLISMIRGTAKTGVVESGWLFCDEGSPSADAQSGNHHDECVPPNDAT
jgi:hypothetical protein